MNANIRFRAVYKGRTLGWFDTADEAQAAVDAAMMPEAYFDRFTLKIREEDARAGSHQGQCDDDIEALRALPYLAQQLEALPADDVRNELREWGAWDAAELADHDANLSRLLWIACGNVHNDYLDPDRAGLNDEQPEQLHEDGTLKGYGRRQHGLNGKDADLDSGGQNRVESAWWFSDGTIRIDGRRYAAIVPGEEWTESQLDSAQEVIFGCSYPGEWDGDYWVFRESYTLETSCANDDDKTEAENLERAIAAAYAAIEADSKAFEEEMASLLRMFDDIDKEG